MFGNKHTDEFITHLQGEIERLSAQVETLQEQMAAKDEAFAREREALLNRLLGLPPQPVIETESEEAMQPIRFKSRTKVMMEELQEKQMREFMLAQSERDKGLEAFRAEVRAEAEAMEGAE